ncbi:hypothetical protein AAFC00_005975 [Neodothiora populina]
MPPLLHSPLPTAGARTPSPNYFAFTSMDESFDSDTNSGQHRRKNWSPPSSTVRSTAAYSPTVVPVDQNPDFDAFRRQSEGKVFNLGNLHTFNQPSPRPDCQKRTQSHQSTISDPFFKFVSEPKQMAPPLAKSTSNNSLDPEAAWTGRSPKRHLSNDSTNYPDAIRRITPPAPPPFDSLVAGVERGMPRLSMPPELKLPPLGGRTKARSETVPVSTAADDQASSLVTPQHVINLMESAPEEILILDLRVSTQYARSKITGALNLCIPTTLLKRPSFNVQKLAETFRDGSAERAKFENWQSTKYLIVYDASSAQVKDALTCMNTLKKFRSEAYNGSLYAVKGGFAEFSSKFPKYVESPRSELAGAPQRLDLDGPEVAPVVGGCPMPATKNAANPFFGNIRQNMDLIGGVGQMPIKRPAQMSRASESRIPSWLREASNESDKGARVSEKFLHIEQREQRRMQDALSGQVSYGEPTNDDADKVKIAGIEKGTKNRYNNIWPYEHTRVKLQDVPDHACDYVNASHVTSSRSHKKYIATQGPIPATFTDFWNVVWQQDVRVIVMLTAEKEGGQVKAHNYWSDKQYGPMRLEFLSEKRASLDPNKIKKHRQRPSLNGRMSTDGPLARIDTATTTNTADPDQPFVIVRRLALSHEDYPFERMREITQLQYSSWPDFGAPAHPSHLLGLVEQCDAVVRKSTSKGHADPDPPKSRPILVHCSAGCGRTGTFCTVDTVIDMVKRQRMARRNAASNGVEDPMEIDRSSTTASRGSQRDQNSFFGSHKASAPPAAANDDDGIEQGSWLTRDNQDLIEKTVEDFRLQRLSMVQSLRQFVLCYESVMEWIVEHDESE